MVNKAEWQANERLRLESERDKATADREKRAAEKDALDQRVKNAEDEYAAVKNDPTKADAAAEAVRVARKAREDWALGRTGAPVVAPTPQQAAATEAAQATSAPARALAAIGHAAIKEADDMLARNYAPIYKDVAVKQPVLDAQGKPIPGQFTTTQMRQQVVSEVQRPEFKYERAIADVTDMMDHANTAVNKDAARQKVFNFMLQHQEDKAIAAELARFRAEGKNKGMVATNRRPEHNFIDHIKTLADLENYKADIEAMTPEQQREFGLELRARGVL
jgi:hypothetical protein